MATVITTRSPRPDWLKVRLPTGDDYFRLKGIMRDKGLHTVCEEARCPNVAECWGQGTATFMILGDVCTRSCGFCAVKTGLPQFLDQDEPRRVADAVEAMGLTHAVITSVNRDELPDGGAAMFARTIEAVRERMPETSIEVLIPDFKGSRASLETVLGARPEILNHNIETVPRLYRHVRSGARFAQSVALLRRGKEIRNEIVSKTGIMLGLGESLDEVEAFEAGEGNQKRNRQQDGHHAWARRKPRRSRSGHARARRRSRCRCVHHRPVPPADERASAGRAFRSSRRIQRAGRTRPRDRFPPRGVRPVSTKLVPRREPDSFKPRVTTRIREPGGYVVLFVEQPE